MRTALLQSAQSRDKRTLSVLRMAVPLGLMAIGLALAHAQGGPPSHPTIFTGNVTAEDHSDIQNTRVRFESGARTYWHSHAGGQVLVVVEGVGRMQDLGGPVRDLRVADAVYTKPGVAHWHGAAPGHYAVMISAYIGELDWKQEVTEEEYLGKSR